MKENKNLSASASVKKKISFAELWKNKRARSIIVSGGIILICTIVYVVLLLTVLQPDEGFQQPTIGNHGEQMANGRPFVIDPVEPDQILSIKVDNLEGGYHYYRGEDNQFYFKNAEHMLYNNSSAWMTMDYEDLTDMMESISIIDSLMGLSRYMLATEEVVGYNKDNLAAYGLEGTGKASLTITSLDKEGKEVENTVYIGNLTVSGTGYYAMLKGRDALYILSEQSVTRSVFANLTEFLTPQVAPYVSTSVYTEATTVEVKKNGKVFLSVRELTEEEFTLNAELFTHVFETPEGYFPSTERFPQLLETFTNFTGSQVMEWGITDRLSDPAQADKMTEMFRLYSLMDSDKNWNYELNYHYDSLKLEVTLYISEKLQVEDETADEGAEPRYIYYVYSPAFDLIAEFDAEEIPWVEWDLLTFMDNHSFATTIDSVSSIELKYNNTDVKFSLQGEGNDLKVSCSTGVAIDTDNFRQLYKAILYTTMDGYADKPESASQILSLKITLRNETVYEYQFYGLTARKAYYTLNGSGEFYINRDYVKQIISACTGILAGEQVTVNRMN